MTICIPNMSYPLNPALCGVPSLPADEIHLAAYLIHLCDQSQSLGPALAARSAIYHYHWLQPPDGPRPTESTKVVMTMGGLKKTWEKAKQKAAPFTADLLKKVKESLTGEDPSIVPVKNHRMAALSVPLARAGQV